jgi:conjugal transfer mating pair stabilization protein TraG
VSADPPHATEAYTTIRNALSAYIADCTLTGLDLEKKDGNDLFSSGDPLSTIGGIGFESLWATTVTAIGAGGTGQRSPYNIAQQPVYVTCTEALARLNGSKISLPGVLDATLGKTMKVQEIGGVTATLETAFASLGQRLAFDAQNYMMSAMIKATYATAAMTGGVTTSSKAILAVSAAQAAEQRATESVLEEHLFVRLMRPMTSFFENLIYFLVPIFSFVIFFGSPGIQMVMKGLLLTLWVTLWPSTLAFINVFQNTSMEIELARIVAAQSLNSVWSVATIHAEAIDWITAGSLLAAATPALTLSILVGGAVSMSYLAGRMQGNDVINEKLASPDALQTAPSMQASSLITGNPTDGVSRAGAGAVQMRFSVGDGAQASVKSAQMRSEASSSQLSTELGKILTSGSQFGEQWGNQFMDSIRNSNSTAMQQATAFSTSHSAGSSQASKWGITDKEMASLLVGGNLGVAAMKFAANKLGLESRESQEEFVSWAKDAQQKWDTTVKSDETLQTSVTQERARAIQDTSIEGAQTTEAYQDMTRLKRTATTAATDARSYEEATARVEKLDSSRTFTTGNFAAKTENDSDLRAYLMSEVHGAGAGSVLQHNLRQARDSEHILTEDQAQMAALLLTVSGKGQGFAIEGNNGADIESMRMNMGAAYGRAVEAMGNTTGLALESSTGAGSSAFVTVATDVKPVTPEDLAQVTGAETSVARVDSEVQTRQDRAPGNEPLPNPITTTHEAVLNDGEAAVQRQGHADARVIDGTSPGIGGGLRGINSYFNRVAASVSVPEDDGTPDRQAFNNRTQTGQFPDPNAPAPVEMTPQHSQDVNQRLAAIDAVDHQRYLAESPANTAAALAAIDAEDAKRFANEDNVQHASAPAPERQQPAGPAAGTVPLSTR